MQGYFAELVSRCSGSESHGSISCRSNGYKDRQLQLDIFFDSLIDPLTGTKEHAKATEAQAIARAYRQGQKNNVTVVRFIIQDTLDHQLYLRNTQSEGEAGVSIADKNSGRSQVVRTTSLSALLANTKAVQLAAAPASSSSIGFAAVAADAPLLHRRASSIAKILIKNPDLSESK